MARTGAGRPRRDDTEHVGRAEAVKLDADLADKLYILARCRRTNVAKLTTPLIEEWVRQEFTAVPDAARELVAQGPTPDLLIPRAQRKPPGGGAERQGAESVKFSAWTVFRLNVIGALRRLTVDEMVAPAIRPVVDEMWRDFIMAECARLCGEPASG